MSHTHAQKQLESVNNVYVQLENPEHAQEIMQKAESILTKENNFLRQVKIKHVTHMHKNNMDNVQLGDPSGAEGVTQLLQEAQQEAQGVKEAKEDVTNEDEYITTKL